MKTLLALAILLTSVHASAEAYAWKELNKVCYSNLNTSNPYNDLRNVMRQCNDFVSTLNKLATDDFVIKGTCTEAREGTFGCWGAKLQVKVLTVAE